MFFIAHRGAAGLYLENTLAAFHNAISLGFHGAELDVHLSLDGEVVVHHNPSLNYEYTRDRDGNWLDKKSAQLFSRMSLEEIQGYALEAANPASGYLRRFPEVLSEPGQFIPSLRQVIRAVKERSSDFFLVIEFKSSWLYMDTEEQPWAPLVDAVLKVIREEDFISRARFCGFDWRVLRYARLRCEDIPLWLSTYPLDWLAEWPHPKADRYPGDTFLRALRAGYQMGAPWFAGFTPESPEGVPQAVREAGGDGWFAYHSDCTPEQLARAGSLGLTTVGWASYVRDRKRLQELAESNLHGLCLDYAPPCPQGVISAPQNQ